MAPSAPTPLIQPETLARLHGLEVAARIIVEGLQTGAHRSPHKGHSVDFADHRPYVAGDDLRHLDWKVLGRSDRLVLKRYEAETDLACLLAIDGSASMGYQGARAALSKFRYASILGATLAHLVLGQQDRAGLILFDEKVAHELKPARQGQLNRICHVLDDHVPAAGTDAVKGLEHLAAPTTHKGLVVLISDLLCDIDALGAAVDRLGHRGHDLAMIWVLDPDELDLGVATVSRFEGLEGEGQLTAEPRSLRDAYAEQVSTHRMALQRICRSRRVSLVECSTAEPPQIPLNRLLVAQNMGR
ncbi:MAG: DUF58 domain-containing protein [Planctomycetes bacterium]|nr:DUF58 domain-containing protein [Planctomycetota bacterium]